MGMMVDSQVGDLEGEETAVGGKDQRVGRAVTSLLVW